MPLLYRESIIFTPWKCGSVSTREAVVQGGGRIVGAQHRRPSEHPELRGERLGLIRDPWTWYASLYHFALHRRMVGNVRTWCGGGEPTLRDFVYGVTHPTPGRIPATAGCVFWCGKPEAIVASGKGLHGWAFGWFYGDAPIGYIATDRLDEALTSLGLPTARSHVGEVSGYAEAYDADMIRWVAEAEADTIERLGFRPFEPTPWAIHRSPPQP